MKSILVRRVASAMALGPVGLGAVLAISVGEAHAANETALIDLGKRVFFDPISRPRGRQACVSCHDPASGWTGPNAIVNQKIVANPGAAFHGFLSFRGLFRRFDAIGTLKPPSNAYASLVPTFKDNCNGGPFVPPVCGGVFWNGRAEGVGEDNLTAPLFDLEGSDGGTATITPDEVFNGNPNLLAYQKYLGPVAEQALNPFENPAEQNTDREAVCKHVQKARYGELYTKAWDEPIKCDFSDDIDRSFKRIAVALAAYQDSPEVNQFSSKRDKALDGDQTFPLDGFSDLENYGHDLFYAVSFAGGISSGQARPSECGGDSAQGKAANCVVCHNSNPADTTGVSETQFYADPFYHNIGTPLNREIPNNPGPNPGLKGHTGVAEHAGLMRTPPLRNVDKRPRPGFVKAYAHNGWFKSLESIVHFYNTGLVYTPNCKDETGGGANGDQPDDICDSDIAATPNSSSTAATFSVGKPIVRCFGAMTEREAKAANCWPKPASEKDLALTPVAAAGPNATRGVIGDLKLDACDEKAIVAYLKTLSDTRPVRSPAPYRPGSIPR